MSITRRSFMGALAALGGGLVSFFKPSGKVAAELSPFRVPGQPREWTLSRYYSLYGEMLVVGPDREVVTVCDEHGNSGKVSDILPGDICVMRSYEPRPGRLLQSNRLEVIELQTDADGSQWLRTISPDSNNRVSYLCLVREGKEVEYADHT